MTDKLFFDTNLIVYLFDKSEVNKQNCVKELINKKATDSIVCFSL